MQLTDRKHDVGNRHSLAQKKLLCVEHETQLGFSCYCFGLCVYVCVWVKDVNKYLWAAQDLPFIYWGCFFLFKSACLLNINSSRKRLGLVASLFCFSNNRTGKTVVNLDCWVMSRTAFKCTLCGLRIVHATCLLSSIERFLLVGKCLWRCSNSDCFCKGQMHPLLYRIQLGSWTPCLMTYSYFLNCTA